MRRADTAHLRLPVVVLITASMTAACGESPNRDETGGLATGSGCGAAG